MTDFLNGKVAVVTDVGSGNGWAIARRFAEHGVDIVIDDLQREPLEAVGRQTNSSRRRLTQTHDTTSAMAPTRLYSTISWRPTTTTVASMVNNTAILRETTFLEVDKEEFDIVLDVNLNGVFFGI